MRDEYQIILRRISVKSTPCDVQQILTTLNLDSNVEAVEIVKNSDKELYVRVIITPTMDQSTLEK